MNKNKNLTKSPTRGKRNSNRRGKQMEVNVGDRNVNFADLPHIVTGAKADNDKIWYNNIPELVEALANLPFVLRSGGYQNPMSEASLAKENMEADPTVERRPGIMTLYLTPTYGESLDPQSALNMVAKEVFTTIRLNNSGALQVDQNDVIMAIIGADNAYMLYEWIMRAYRSSQSVDYNTEYMPEALLKAQGFDPEDFKANRANYRSLLTSMALRLAKLTIPNVFDIFKRHSWLFSNVYLDQSSSKAQYYLYSPSAVYVYKEGAEDNLTFLSLQRLTALADQTMGNITYEGVQRIVDAVLNPLLGSEDFMQVSGLLLKAFGTSNLVQVAYPKEQDPLVPAYSAEVLQQIENAYIVPLPTSTVRWNITQNAESTVNGPFLECTFPGSYYDPVGSTGSGDPGWATKRLVNFHSLNPDKLDIIEATMLTGTMRLSPVSGGGVNMYYQPASEIVTSMTITTLQGSKGNVSSLKMINFTSSSQGFVNGTGQFLGYYPLAPETFSNYVALSAFDWAPSIYWYLLETTPEGKSYKFIGTLTDIDNYSWVETVDIARLHYVAIMSLLKDKSFPVK